ncbi:MAG: hypothetical protein ACXAEU_16895 [Candidatus Hodarchaeales archaeon]|jgi:hypothetical protein
MIVYAVYVISEDGRSIVSEHFQSAEDIPDDLMLSGLLTALQGVAAEVSKDQSELKSIEIEGLSYHIRYFGFYRVVLVTDVIKTPEDIIQTLGLRFMKEFGEVLMEGGGLVNLKTFSPFKKTIYEIIKQETISDESKSMRPTRKLTTGDIFNLDHELQPTALAMISLEEGTVEEIANESNLSIEITEKNVIKLQESGYIGEKYTNEKTIYFCSI